MRSITNEAGLDQVSVSEETIWNDKIVIQSAIGKNRPHTNPQHSIDLTTKSSSLESVWLPNVLQGWELPWYKSPSSHKPKLPLYKDIGK